MAAALERELKIQRDDVAKLSEQIRRLEVIASDLKTFIEIFRANQENFKQLLVSLKSNFDEEIESQNLINNEVKSRISELEKTNISTSWQLRIQSAFILFLMGSQMSDISKWTVKLAKAFGGG